MEAPCGQVLCKRGVKPPLVGKLAYCPICDIYDIYDDILSAETPLDRWARQRAEDLRKAFGRIPIKMRVQRKKLREMWQGQLRQWLSSVPTPSPPPKRAEFAATKAFVADYAALELRVVGDLLNRRAPIVLLPIKARVTIIDLDSAGEWLKVGAEQAAAPSVLPAHGNHGVDEVVAAIGALPGPSVEAPGEEPALQPMKYTPGRVYPTFPPKQLVFRDVPLKPLRAPVGGDPGAPKDSSTKEGDDNE